MLNKTFQYTYILHHKYCNLALTYFGLMRSGFIFFFFSFFKTRSHYETLAGLEFGM